MTTRAEQLLISTVTQLLQENAKLRVWAEHMWDCPRCNGYGAYTCDTAELMRADVESKTLTLSPIGVNDAEQESKVQIPVDQQEDL